MKNKFKMGKIFKTTILILPAIIFILLISFDSIGNNQNKEEKNFDENNFEYNPL